MRESVRSWMVASTLLAGLGACRSDKPEDQVRRSFEACRVAVEAGDADQASKPLDGAFRGPEGMDKASARRYLMALLREQRVGVTVLRNSVVAQGDEVIQEVDLVLTEGRNGLLPREVSRRSFHLRWQKVSGDYRLVDMEALDRP